MTPLLDTLDRLLSTAVPLPWTSKDKRIVHDANGYWVADFDADPTAAELTALLVSAGPALIRLARAAVAWRDANVADPSDANLYRGVDDALTDAITALGEVGK